MLFCQILLSFSLIFKVESFARIVDRPIEICTPSNQNNEIEEVATLKKSYTCSEVKYLSQIVNNIPLNIEEVVITNSNIFSEEEFDGENYVTLANIKIVKSFIGPTALKWLGSLKNMKSLSLLGSHTGWAIDHEDQNRTVLELKLNSFKSVQKLEISGGNITNLEVKNLSTLPYLDLSDNNFECGHDFIWLLRQQAKSRKVVLNNTFCFVTKLAHPQTHYPMKYTFSGKPFVPVMDYKREALDNCPPKCSCEMNGMVTVDRPQLTVDCMGLNMTKLPDVIPKGTAKCNFTYNFIDDLSPMYTNKLYDKVAMMALSHNNIAFLDPVQFPELLRKRRDLGFSLNYNRLQKFPAAAIKDIYHEALKKNRFMPQFHLAHNPWICSCDYIADFQDLVYRQMYEIRDSREIRCSVDDEYNPGVMVLTLDVGMLCSKELGINTLDVLNILLGLLLLVLLCDFFYNWRQYRKNRKLPWIVTKFKF